MSNSRKIGEVTLEFIEHEVGPNLVVPLALLLPPQREGMPVPVVIGLAQEGKQAFLKNRSELIAALLQSGVAVCLPDLRGTGETRPAGDSRGRTSASTSISSTELMFGQTLLGSRLRDLRAVLQLLQQIKCLDMTHVALWGDSFAPVNPDDRRLEVPWDAEKLPDQSEPLGGLLALFGALFEDNVRAIYIRGGLIGYHSILESPFCYVPHDAIVPGALSAGDLCDVAAALAPRPLRLEGLVDGLNRRVAADKLAKTFEPTRTAYRAAKAEDRLEIDAKINENGQIAQWLLKQLKGK